MVLGAAALTTLGKKYKKKKRTRRNANKRLHIFLDESKKGFFGCKDVQKPWVFSTCEAFIE
jgi:hypothetical protein